MITQYSDSETEYSEHVKNVPVALYTLGPEHLPTFLFPQDLIIILTFVLDILPHFWWFYFWMLSNLKKMTRILQGNLGYI